MEVLKEIRDVKSFKKSFPTEEVATTFFVERRWGNDIKCVYCDSERVYVSNTKQPFKCGQCNKKFTAKTGTIMEGSHIEIRTWLLAMYIMATASKGISSIQFSKKLNTTQKTAWFIAQRIHEACNNVERLIRLSDFDKTFTYSKDKNKHFINGHREIKTNKAISIIDALSIKTKSNIINYK